MQPITVSTPYKSERIHLDVVCLNIAVALCLKDSHLRYISLGYLDLNQGENQSFKGSRLTNLAIPQRVMNLVHPTGLEPVTRCLEGSCSIQLSYGCINDQCCYTYFTCAVHRSLFNLVLNFVGEVGLEPTCPLGSGFTGRRANQIAQSTQNFCRFKRVPTSQWATTFALQGYLLLRFQMLAPLSYKFNSYFISE